MTGSDQVLGSPVWTALQGPHRRFAVPEPVDAETLAVRYQPEVAGFAALSDIDDPQAWAQLALLIEPGGQVALFGAAAVPAPAGWTVAATIGVSQLTYSDASLVADSQLARPGDELVTLSQADVAQMQELVELTKPGPFSTRTIELGGYLGLRRDGRLVAMAGRRFQPPGWVEISAVCTHPDHRGRGLSRRLINAVIKQIDDSGQRPFLHVTHDNPAAALYYRLGFSHRTDAVITVVRAGG
jgi:ribosomal protein S18 acetylase RimI-like enzyme